MSFFEGTEKLLEVWFGSSHKDRTADLRLIPREFWDDLLDLVQCKILSVVKNESIHAYVLSESSMFISKNRFILKTCGTTTLLYAVQPLLKKVKEYCGFDIVEDVFYSRKKFMQPHLQEKLHQRFEDEVKYLDQLFKDGGAYILGKLNADAWYLYTTNPQLTSPGRGVIEPDQTLEVLLSGLDPEVMKIFTTEVSKTATQATAHSGIAELLPGAQIDDYLFEPCGYSMNGILPDARYITIHITPEPECSYVSFETNVPQQVWYSTVICLVCP
ncbi:S-adenosylmethionine decarboxylase proenzyme isoform X2 [Lingula anatina]|uniref:adenosylmethionine decarboxylase n=1 Tax=Lingula anatina TaxID=7574 RepID=A0A1S3H4J4_LINAN|nr:S-adenosylmethionine decarboxylase proenzyme isoform X2 [Lingula anatina]|eukprot:XP_013381055.1 S-adenosylmethionine decarboxylase proenzyme isoform X2 [Lingula anatina]